MIESCGMLKASTSGGLRITSGHKGLAISHGEWVPYMRHICSNTVRRQIVFWAYCWEGDLLSVLLGAHSGAGLLGMPGRCSGGRRAGGRRSNSSTFFASVVPVSLRGLSQRLLCATSLRKEIEYTGACIVLWERTYGACIFSSKGGDRGMQVSLTEGLCLRFGAASMFLTIAGCF